MSENEELQQNTLLELMRTAITATSLEEFVQKALPVTAETLMSPWVFLYISDARLLVPVCFHYGLKGDTAVEIETICATLLLSQNKIKAPIIDISRGPGEAMAFYPLRYDDTMLGLLAFQNQENPPSPELREQLYWLNTNTFNRLIDNMKTARQIMHLNTYMTVSSMLAQSMGLHELLEAVLYSCMDAVSAEAASVLLLDESKKNLVFYHVEGATKQLLMAATFPADFGIAGSVLQTQQSEVVNNVLQDARFYKNIDSKTGFYTRNMIAVPLVAGEEKIGVLEVLNKTGGAEFTEEERLLLCSIAEEIAFAIRNAKMFEYVADSYCKQRQGEPSCKGCKRPLGSWTPCTKYRETIQLP
jgi:putative methionine-R-sulfoxide reductase with GAF domain